VIIMLLFCLMHDQVDHTSTNSSGVVNRALELRDLAPILGLILLTIVLYYPLLLGIPVMPDTWERYEPWNSELGLSGPTDPEIRHSNFDPIFLYTAWNKFAHDELRAGRIPAWDPYCLGGIPLMQNHLVPVFYPIYALIAWLFPPLLILGISGFFHTLIIGIFFYLFLREWVGNRIASWSTASFLIVSLLLISYDQTILVTTAFFIAIWFFHERWLKHRSPWAGLWMALCWSVPLLAGYPTLFVQLGLFTVVWFFLRARAIAPELRPSWQASALILVLPFILGLGISMVQNIPTLLASADSDRVVFKSPEELASEYSGAVTKNESWQVLVKRLLQPVFPLMLNRFGPRIHGNVGIIPFVFALFGITAWRRKEYPRILVVIALVIAPFALIPALNNASYILTRRIFILPVAPQELLGLLILMLSAIGVKQWMEIANAKKPVNFIFTFEYVPIVVGILIAFLGSIFIGSGSLVPTGNPILMTIAGTTIIISAFFIRKMMQIKIAVGIIVIMTLYTAVMSGTFVLSDFTSPISRNPLPETRIIKALENLTDPENGGSWGRIIRYSNDPVNVLSLSDQPFIFYPNLGTYFRIPDAFGYHNLAPKSRFDYLRGIQDEMVIKRRGIAFFTPPTDLYDQRLFNMGVRYVLAGSELDGLVPIIDSEHFLVYDLYDQPGHNTPPRRVSIIPLPETSDSGGGIIPEVLSVPEIKLDEPGRFIAETDSESPGLLIFNEGYADGWSVKVDDENQELRIYENFSMAVDIESGRHVVEFRYRMPGWKEGMTVTVTSLLLWIVIGVLIIPENKK
ncbi:MAG: YfhO family protein, partial [bacterium]|nr:YfhO family protein [bacterium]